MDRIEIITRGDGDSVELAPGFRVRVFASGSLGARGLTTCAATAKAGARLPYHTHPTGEAITVAVGEAEVLVEGRRYVLRPYDAIHVPAGVAHAVRNAMTADIVLHTSFPTEAPDREFVEDAFSPVDRSETDESCPEVLRRFEKAHRYELHPRTEVCDLFARRFGSLGVCGGYAQFGSGASLPCHVHDYDESITIVEGRAVCQVAGKEYELSNFDTACIPRGRPHRFFNRGDGPMTMIWVYAGDEPDREIVDQNCCES